MTNDLSELTQELTQEKNPSDDQKVFLDTLPSQEKSQSIAQNVITDLSKYTQEPTDQVPILEENLLNNP